MNYPKFNATGKEAYQMLEKTGIYALRALLLYIGLDEFYFDKYIKGKQYFTSYHYPPLLTNLKMELFVQLLMVTST